MKIIVPIAFTSEFQGSVNNSHVAWRPSFDVASIPQFKKVKNMSPAVHVHIKLHVVINVCILETAWVIFMFDLQVFMIKTRPQSFSNSPWTSSVIHHMLFWIFRLFKNWRTAPYKVEKNSNQGDSCHYYCD